MVLNRYENLWYTIIKMTVNMRSDNYEQWWKDSGKK